MRFRCPPRPGLCLLLALAAGWAAAPPRAAAQPPKRENAAEVVGRIIAAEHRFEQTMRRFRPRVETYVQKLRPSRDRGAVPAGDAYFLGTLDARGGLNEVLFKGRNHGNLARKFLPLGFAAMISPDWKHFDRKHYQFAYAGQQFLGAVRCFVFDVTPRAGTADGSFLGRIWAEERNDTIVRFDGTYVPNRKHRYVHFDSWRMNMGPNLWLPAAIYSQEADQPVGWFGRHIAFQAQTRFWGYKLSAVHPPIPLAQVTIVPGQGVTLDTGGGARQRSPLAREHAWEHKAEEDVLARLQRAGLLAPEGPVAKVLDTVVENIEATNRIRFTPPVRCRVLLTTPLASFAIGHTIVVSRGLIDVLPNEASLAMVLALELGHIALDQPINTGYAFDDEMIFRDIELFARLRITRSAAQQAAANAKGLELLEHSPYKNQMAAAGLFLEALQRAAPGLPNLITPQMGSPWVVHGRVVEMRALLASAPRLQIRNLHQVPALPLGARIQLNPWNDRLRLLGTATPPLLSPRDKLSFAITPFLPYLRRESKAERIAETAQRNY